MTGFAPDSLMLTERGYEEMSSLVGKDVTYWDGKSFVHGAVNLSSSAAELVVVRTNTMLEVQCHPAQPFTVKVFTQPSSHATLEARELVRGDSLRRLPEAPVCFGGQEDFPYAYTHGFYTGNEKHKRGRLVLQRASIFGYRRPALKFLELDLERTTKHSVFFPSHIGEDFAVPLDVKYSLDTKLDWLAGLFDAGLHKRKIKPIPIWHYYSSNPDFLYQTKLLLQTLGVDSRFVLNDDPKAYLYYSFSIRAKGMEVLRDLGLPSKLHVFDTYSTRVNVKGAQGTQNAFVSSVDRAFRSSETCVIVPEDRSTSSAVINGIYVPIK